MSILTNVGGTTANMYLAEVVNEHAGKTFRIELFDAGDGTAGTFDLSIVKPDGAVATCNYNTPTGTILNNQTCTHPAPRSGGRPTSTTTSG